LYSWLDGKVLPLLPLPHTHCNPDVVDGGEEVVGVGAEWVLLEVQLLQTGAGLYGVHLNICNKVFVCVDVRQGRHLQKDRGQGDEGVGRDVDHLQPGASVHLVGKAGDPVVGEVQLCDEGEGEGQLGGDLGDDVVVEAA